MKPVNITHAGKPYESLSEPLQQAAIDGMKNMIEKLKPFEQDLIASGGKLTVDIDRDFPGASIITECVPCDLTIRIVEALRSSS